MIAARQRAGRRPFGGRRPVGTQVKLVTNLLVIVTLLLGAITFTAAEAGAADSDAVTWSITPTKQQGKPRISFRYNLKKGNRVQDRVKITNSGSTPATFRLYASDGITTAEGTFDLLAPGTAPSDAGSWIKLARKRVTLAPGQSTSVRFTLVVPKDTLPGDHPAGIVAALVSDGDSGDVSVERRVGARVHLRVAGTVRPELQITSLTTDYTGSWRWGGRGPATVSFDVVNTGNVRLTGSASVELSSPFGFWKHSVDLGAVPELLPHYKHRMTVTIKDAPAAVMLTASARVVPQKVGADKITPKLVGDTASTRSWAMPWWWMLGFIVLVVLLALIVQTRGRHRRQLAALAARAERAERAEPVERAERVDVRTAGEAGLD